MNLGKILICVHFGLSLVFFSWALVLYVTRIDFSNQQQPAGQPPGELTVRIAELNRLVNQKVRPSYERWYVTRGEVTKSQGGGPAEKKWYGSALNFLRDGEAGEQNPIEQVARREDGQPIPLENVPDPASGPFLRMQKIQDKNGKNLQDRDGKDFLLRSLTFYDEEMPKLSAKILNLNGWEGDIKDAVAQELKGTLDPGKKPSGAVWDIMRLAAKEKQH